MRIELSYSVGTQSGQRRLGGHGVGTGVSGHRPLQAWPTAPTGPTIVAMPSDAVSDSNRLCPECGMMLPPQWDECPWCSGSMDDIGTAGATPDPRAIGQERRRGISRRKNVSDVFFLMGLLSGGPLVSFDIQFTFGLVLMLGAGVASTLVRYTAFSAPGALLAGGLGALTFVSAVLDPPGPADVEDSDTREAAREAYVGELARQFEGDGIVVEARGGGAVTVWFFPPAVLATSCGAFPDKPIREHLAALGFRRIVVNIRSEGQGVCSFHP